MKIIVTCFLALFLFSVAPSLTGAQMAGLRGGKMMSCSGLPCVDLTLSSGKHLRMLIDTGNNESVMDRSVAMQLGLAISHEQSARGKQMEGAEYAILPNVMLGDAPFGDVKISIFDGIAELMEKDRAPMADGSLAYPAFKDRLVELDYLHRDVRVSAPLSSEVSCPDKCGKLTTPTFGKHGPPILVSDGFSVDGKTVTAQIDTLFTGTMLIFNSAVERLGFSKLADTDKKQFFKYTDGGVDMLVSRSSVFSFGADVLAKDAPLYFSTPTVHQPDGMFDACVGQQLFGHSVLYFDFHDMKFWISH